MRVVAGLSLKNLQPRVWDPASPYHLPGLDAVMVSYAEFHEQPARQRAALKQGLHTFLGVPSDIQIYLDNGSFAFLRRGNEPPRAAYETFVRRARPDWYPIPRDYIPTPAMTDEEQQDCMARTIAVNNAYSHDGYVPVIHVGRLLEQYLVAVQSRTELSTKPGVALGGIVPNLLRAPKAIPYEDVIATLERVRQAFASRQVHVFGLGGTATLHLAALLGIDSADSSGWRNRAARGIVQLPGGGDRTVANLGSWRGRAPGTAEWAKLETCPCPACRQFGVDGLKATALAGFCNRATHNLWVLLEETREVERRLADSSYASWYESHLNNSIYLPLVRRALASRPARSQ